jgi:Protein of unknown function (DUF4242)
MRKYVIEREIPGVGKMSPAELRAVSQKSNEILRELGPGIQWIQSYVVDDKLYCVYLAANPGLIREHARCTGVPASRISEVVTMIDPTTGEP